MTDTNKTHNRSQYTYDANESSHSMTCDVTIDHEEQNPSDLLHNQVSIQEYLCNKININFSSYIDIFRRVPLWNEKPLELVEINKDGNCFFNSISTAMTGNQYQHLAIRKKVIKHAIEKKKIYNQ